MRAYFRRIFGKNPPVQELPKEEQKKPDTIPLKEEKILLTEELLGFCREEAAAFQVVPDIHPDDFIFQFILTNPYFTNPKDAVHYYFNDGKNSARRLSAILTNVLHLGHSPIQLLEFASGYGCVTRHLPRMVPAAHATACDIHEQATGFIQQTMGIDTVLSHSVPEEVRFPREYDVIFALSFFSHMPRSSWGRWIQTLYRSVAPSGYLIFTTQGQESLKYQPDAVMPPDGFLFTPGSEQKDLASEEYGITVTLPDWVIPEVYRMTQAPLVCYKKAYWWGHQDLYILKKI